MAAEIVSNLLGFSRRSSDHAAPHDLNALVEQTLELPVSRTKAPIEKDELATQ
jgi:hypothetical protein